VRRASCWLTSQERPAKNPFNDYVRSSAPSETASTLRRAQHAFWNAFKHATKLDHVTERDDATLLLDFSDADNDHLLFVGWYDCANVAEQLPIEAQLFQVWYFAAYPEDVGRHIDSSASELIFLGIVHLDRAAQKQMLRGAIVTHRQLVGDVPNTERLPLVLPRFH
jgi:hypothetical protein